MTTAEQEYTPAEFDKPHEMVLRRAAAIRLGQLANYLTAIAKQMRDPQLALPAKELGVAEGGLQGMVEALTEYEDADDALAALNESATAYAPERPRLEANEYPNLPFYQGIIPADEIPAVNPGDPSAAITLRILRNNHIEVNGNVRELRGEVLYLFNAFLTHRDAPVGIRALLGHGFRESADDSVTRTRFHIAFRGLRGMLNEITPEDFVPIHDIGLSTKLRERLLNPDFVIEDVRDDPAYDHLVTNVLPFASKREAAEAAEAAPQGYPLAWITREAGVHHTTLERRMTTADWDAAFTGPGGVVLFPIELAKEIVERFDEHKRPLETLPEGWVRVAEVIAQLPGDMMTSRALDRLRKAGLEPRQVNLEKKYARRGGIWCVQEEGALDALSDVQRRAPATHAARALASPAPDLAVRDEITIAVSPPMREPVEEIRPEPVTAPALMAIEAEASVSLQLRNSAAQIAAHIWNQAPDLQGKVTAHAVEIAAMQDRMVRPEYGRDGAASYSYYAASRIAKAVMQEHGREYLSEE